MAIEQIINNMAFKIFLNLSDEVVLQKILIFLYSIHGLDFFIKHDVSETGSASVVGSCGQPTKGGPPSWGLGEGLTTLDREKPSCYICYKEIQNRGFID
jgi:hypothetical protein